MKFSKYSSIDNSYRSKTIFTYKQHKCAEGRWIVQEKVHGSNLSFWCDGNDFKVFSRSQQVQPENFFGCGDAVDETKLPVLSLFEELSKTDRSGQRPELAVYGELYGGHYPHPDVKKTNDRMIQKGVCYRPNHGFYAFDIRWNGHFLDVDEAEHLLKRHGFFYARTLFEGTMDECLNYDCEFDSKLPEWLGLPPIEDNICEGIVIRPKTASYLDCGSRIILKKKNQRFAEKAKMASGKNQTNKPETMNETAIVVFDVLKALANENRLRSVLSKIGPVTNKMFGRILKDMQEDVFEDYFKDYDAALWESLTEKQKGVIRKTLNSTIASLIRPNFTNIINGTF